MSRREKLEPSRHGALNIEETFTAEPKRDVRPFSWLRVSRVEADDLPLPSTGRGIEGEGWGRFDRRAWVCCRESGHRRLNIKPKLGSTPAPGVAGPAAGPASERVTME